MTLKHQAEVLGWNLEAQLLCWSDCREESCSLAWESEKKQSLSCLTRILEPTALFHRPLAYHPPLARSVWVYGPLAILPVPWSLRAFTIEGRRREGGASVSPSTQGFSHQPAPGFAFYLRGWWVASSLHTDTGCPGSWGLL